MFSSKRNRLKYLLAGAAALGLAVLPAYHWIRSHTDFFRTNAKQEYLLPYQHAYQLPWDMSRTISPSSLEAIVAANGFVPYRTNASSPNEAQLVILGDIHSDSICRAGEHRILQTLFQSGDAILLELSPFRFDAEQLKHEMEQFGTFDLNALMGIADTNAAIAVAKAANTSSRVPWISLEEKIDDYLGALHTFYHQNIPGYHLAFEGKGLFYGIDADPETKFGMYVKSTVESTLLKAAYIQGVLGNDNFHPVQAWLIYESLHLFDRKTSLGTKKKIIQKYLQLLEEAQKKAIYQRENQIIENVILRVHGMYPHQSYLMIGTNHIVDDGLLKGESLLLTALERHGIRYAAFLPGSLVSTSSPPTSPQQTIQYTQALIQKYMEHQKEHNNPSYHGTYEGLGRHLLLLQTHAHLFPH
ncbi:hypothetical protein HZB01_03920 [Candidatus Woesearchaeota archaeon]|nr:hypothetical protein [Candidatus Woesearchaeota archaeon]